MLINTIPHGEKLSGEFRKLITELIVSCYMALIIAYLSILHWKKRCIKFIWSLMNSKHTLYNSIVKYSLFNASTVIDENIRYLMSKYGIYEH